MLIPFFVIVFIAFLGYSMMITVYTPMLMKPFYGIVDPETTLSWRVVMLGILLALYPLGQFFGSPFILHLSSLFCRKRIYLGSLFMTMLGYAWIAYSLDIHSLGLLMAATFFTGFSESNVSMALHAITEYSDPSQRSKWITRIQIFSSGAFLFGPLFAGLLTHRAYDSWGWISSSFWVVCFLIGGCLFWIAFLLKNIEMLPRTSISFWQVLKSKRIRPFYVLNFLLYFSIYGFFRAYPMDLVDRFGMNILRLGFLIAWVAVPIVATNFFMIERLLKGFKPRNLAAFGALLGGISMVILALIPHDLVFLLTLLFTAAFGIGLCLPAAPFLISRCSHRQEEGLALENDEAILLGAEGLSSVIGGVLAAFIIQLPLLIFGLLACGIAAKLYVHRR